MSEFFKKPFTQYSSALPYGSNQVQQYNINSGVPVGNTPPQFSLPAQLSSYGKSQSAPRLAAAKAYLPTYGQSQSAPRLAASQAYATAQAPMDAYTASGFGGAGTDPSVMAYGASAPAYDSFGLGNIGNSTFNSDFDSSGYGNVASIPMGSNDLLSTLKGWGGGISDMLPGKDFLFGSTKDGIKTEGALGSLVGVANGLMSGYMGMKQFGLSQDIFDNNKQQFERNFGAQAKLTNASLSDRQDRRNADAQANGRTTQSTADYMKKYGVA